MFEYQLAEHYFLTLNAVDRLISPACNPISKCKYFPPPKKTEKVNVKRREHILSDRYRNQDTYMHKWWRHSSSRLKRNRLSECAAFTEWLATCNTEFGTRQASKSFYGQPWHVLTKLDSSQQYSFLLTTIKPFCSLFSIVLSAGKPNTSYN